MKPKPLIPSEVRARWDSSTIPAPIAVVKAIFRRSPHAKSCVLVERAVSKGVLKSTAKVTISRLKKHYKNK